MILVNGMSSKKVNQKTAQTVSARQWIGIVVVYLLIPLTLFICGGDLGWWQAWIYSLLIVVTGIGGRIWAEQRHPGLLAERQNIEKIQSAKTWDKILAPLMAISIGFPMVIVVIRTELEDRTLCRKSYRAIGTIRSAYAIG